MAENEVQSVQHARLLGLKIINILSWKEHIKEVCTELNQRVGVLKRLRYEFSKNNLKMLADGLVLSKILYGISIYSQTRLQANDPPIGLIHKLQVIQNKAMRIVLRKKRLDKIPIKDLLEEMGWLSVNQLTCKNIVTDVWKTLDKGPEYTRQELVGATPNKTTRSTQRNDLKKQDPGPSFMSQAPYLWNSKLFQHIRNVDTLSHVKRDIRKALAQVPV